MEGWANPKQSIQVGEITVSLSLTTRWLDAMPAAGKAVRCEGRTQSLEADPGGGARWHLKFYGQGAGPT